jgi:hypothetical protein
MNSAAKVVTGVSSTCGEGPSRSSLMTRWRNSALPISPTISPPKTTTKSSVMRHVPFCTPSLR